MTFRIALGVLLMIVLGILLYPVFYLSSADTQKITVTDKERIAQREGGKFLVYTEDEVFENVDSWLFWKFNSSDVQNKLSVDSTYKVRTAGWRVPFLSMHRNIIRIDGVVVYETLDYE